MPAACAKLRRWSGAVAPPPAPRARAAAARRAEVRGLSVKYPKQAAPRGLQLAGGGGGLLLRYIIPPWQRMEQEARSSSPRPEIGAECTMSRVAAPQPLNRVAHRKPRPLLCPGKGGPFRVRRRRRR
eukprot:gene13815-biopygen2721